MHLMALNFNANLSFTLLCLVALLSSLSAQHVPLVARTGKVLQVLVPDKSLFEEFVECSNATSSAKGFCIDVFKSALDILIPKPNWTDVEYHCYKIGTDTYDDLITTMRTKKDPPLDAVVGDITISAARLRNASFTQSYLDSGIVLVTPAVGVPQASFKVFFAPFTMYTWVLIIVSIASTGLALWLLERNDPSYLQGTESRSEQFKEVFWFVTAGLVFFKRESIKNPLAKIVMMAWMIYLVLLGSSYTASLSSILTVNKLSPISLSLKDLSNTSLPVGYQAGSIVSDYLKDRYNITNLVELSNTSEYVDALRTKRIVAVVEEIPYVSLFLAAQSASDCKYAVSSKLTIEGLGFAFFNETLSAAFSVAILNLSESGQLRKLQDGWKLSNFQCPSQVQSTQLDSKNAYIPFVLLAFAMLICILIYLHKHRTLPFCLRNSVRGRSNQRDVPILGRSLTRWFSAPNSVRVGSNRRDVPVFGRSLTR